MNRLVGSAGDERRALDAALATVVRVVDGDTIRVRLPSGAEERVRYIGVDTPERGDCFFRQSTSANHALVPPGERVRLVFDEDRRDRYGRLLAYIRRARDDAFVNEHLVRDGFARPLVVAPNDRFATRFAALSDQARRAGRGLWGRCAVAG